MGLLAESLRQRGLVDPEPEAGASISGGVVDEFGKGLRSGITGIGGGLNALAGTIGEAFGADQFAQNRYVDALRAQQQAQLEAPRVSSFKDIGGLRDAVHYGAGMFGGSFPTLGVGLGAGLLTGGAALPAMALTTGALALPEAGDVALKQLNDPATDAMGAGERVARQLGGGAVSAAAQGLFPTMVAGKLVGKGAGQLVNRSAASIAGRNAGGLVMEGATEAGGSVIKQLAANEAKPLDMDEVAESFVGGMAGGAPLAGVGMAADFANRAPRQAFGAAVDAGKSAVDATADLAGKGMDAMAPAAEFTWDTLKDGAKAFKGAMPESVQRAMDAAGTEMEDQVASAYKAYKDLMAAESVPAHIKEKVEGAAKFMAGKTNRAYIFAADMLRKGADAARGKGRVNEQTRDDDDDSFASALRRLNAPVDDTAERISEGRPLGDTSAFAGADDLTVSEALKRSDTAASAWAQQKIQELQGRADLSDAERQELADAQGMLDTPEGRQKVSRMAQAKQGLDTFLNKLSRFSKGVAEGWQAGKDAGKKSEDYDGFEGLILDRVAPIITKRHPGLMQNPEALATLGSSLRAFMQRAAEDDSVRVMALHQQVADMLGDDAAHEVLSEMFEYATDGNQQKVKTYFQNLQAGLKASSSREELIKLVDKSLPKKAEGRRDPREMARFIDTWARGGFDTGVRERDEAMNLYVRNLMDREFGRKADGVLRAAQAQYRDTLRNGRKQAGTEAAIEEDDTDGSLGSFGISGDRDDIFGPGSEMGTDEEGMRRKYFSKREDKGSPTLYESPAAFKVRNPSSTYKSGAEQMMEKLAEQSPDKRVYFVPLKQYAKARGWNEKQIAAAARGKDPSEVGFIKVEDRSSNEDLQEYEIRAMRGEVERDTHPDALKFGSTIVDATRIARVINQRRREGEGVVDKRNGLTLEEEVALNFAEGVGKLMTQFGTTQLGDTENDIPDSKVIGRFDGKDFTWGEAKKVLGRISTVREDAADRAARQAEEAYYQAMKQIPVKVRERALLAARAELKDVEQNQMSLFPAPADLTRAVKMLQDDQRVGSEQMRDFSNEDMSQLRAEEVALGEKIDAYENAMAQIVSAEIKADNKAANRFMTKPEWLKEFKKRINAMKRENPVDGYVLAKARYDALSYERKVRSGEDNRSEVMNAGMESRDGIPLGRQSTRAGDAKEVGAMNRVARISRTGVAGGAATGEVTADTRSDEAAFAALTQAFGGLNPRVQQQEAQLESVASSRGVMSPGRKRANQREGGEGRMEGDPEGNVHDAAATLGRDMERRNPDLGGRTKVDDELVKRVMHAIGRVRAAKSPISEALANRMQKLLDNPEVVSIEDLRDLALTKNVESLAAINDTVRAIASKYVGQLAPPGERVPPAQRPQRQPIERNPVRFKDGKARGAEYGTDAFNETEQEDLPDPKAVAAKKAALLAKAASGDKALLKELSTSADAKGLQRAVEALLDAPMNDNVRAAIEAINARLAELMQDEATAYGMQTKRYSLETASEAYREWLYNAELQLANEVDFATSRLGLDDAAAESLTKRMEAALRYTRDPETGELLQSGLPDPTAMRELANELAGMGLKNTLTALDTKYSRDATQANNADPLTQAGRAQILAEIKRLLGDSVMVEFKKMMHAGEFFTDQDGIDVIRLSVTALNPMGTAYHESLHAFFKQLRAKGSDDIVAVLNKLAATPHVVAQLKELLSHSPEAQAQLSDPEERAAYLFQFWSMGHEFKLAEAPKNLFTKIKEAILNLMGVWTNDQRAMEIMRYFSSGDYAKDMHDHQAVREALMERGRNQMVDKIQGMTGAFMELAENVLGAGSANLRDSGIPAFAQLADMIKKRGVDKGEDAGWIPAARLKRTEFENRYGELIEGVSEETMRDALEALQSREKAATPEGRILAAGVKKLLRDIRDDYLIPAKVKLGDLGPDYFPRQWDADYLSKHKDQFLTMARKYPQWKDPEETYRKLLANDGSEIQMVVDRPGMGSRHERLLTFLDDRDAAVFMVKDLHRIMDSYITQATRRGEWAKRFGDDNDKLNRLMEDARNEGATPEQISQAMKFVRGVNGTLGDDINPNAKRLMGNMIVYQNIRLLPLAVFSMAVDPMGIVVNGGSLKDAWKAFARGIREIPKGLRGDTSMDEATRFAQDMGTIDNAVMHHAIGSMYTQGITSNFGRKVNDAFFRFNMVEQMNQSMRVAATEAGMAWMAKQVRSPNEHTERRLAELGLTKADLQLDADGRVVITDKTKAALNAWVDGAVLRPDAADKPVWMNDPHWMLVSHLKQFVYAFHHTILARVVHEAKHGNYTPAMALTSYVPIMMAADMLKGMLQGGGDVPEWKRNWGPADYLGNAMQRAGLFGVGQFGIEAATGNIGGLVGPTVEQFGDMAATLGGYRQFSSTALHALPANALYAGFLGNEAADPMRTE